MIDGITVLSQRMITSMPRWIDVVMIVCVVLLVIEFYSLDASDFFRFAMIFTTVMLVIAFLFGVTHGEPTGQYEYQVLIDENANFKEIYDKYEIIDAKGMIYTIRDKGGDSNSNE